MIEAQANGLCCVIADSEDVSKATVLSDNVKCIKTDSKSIEIWAKTLLKARSKHDETKEILMAKGYDITLEAKRLERYYKGLLKD